MQIMTKLELLHILDLLQLHSEAIVVVFVLFYQICPVVCEFFLTVNLDIQSSGIFKEHIVECASDGLNSSLLVSCYLLLTSIKVEVFVFNLGPVA